MEKKSVHNISEWWSLVAIVSIFILASLSRSTIHNLPNALKLEDEIAYPKSFNAERVWRNLQIFNNILSPRTVGSYKSEILTVEFFKSEIAKIQQNAHSNQTISLDVQMVSGSYGYDPLESAGIYHNVQNVVVKLAGENEGIKKSALLLSCHFDTVPFSAGISDDAASCCVMLEILRVLSAQTYKHQRSIIFLFNGAEETGLQGSHGFITKHRWASDVSAYINLDSGGSNGKEMLLQTGSQSNWLLNIYKNTAVHPFGQVSFEEIVRSGILPSESDSMIFQRFGKLKAGIDLVHPFNGYRYHTGYDTINHLTMSVLQRSGDNALALTKAIADTSQSTENNVDERSIYFDVLGYVFIVYTEKIDILLNIAVSIGSVLVPYYFLCRSTQETHRKFIQTEAFFGLVTNFVASTISIAICWLIAFELKYSNNTMSWFTYTLISIGLYGCPTLFVQCILQRVKLHNESPLSMSLRVQSQLVGSCMYWSILILGLTATGWSITYILLVPLLIVTLSNAIIGLSGLQNSIKIWIYVHIVGQIFAVLWTTYHFQLILQLVIPVTGRIAVTLNSENYIGFTVTTFTVLTGTFLVPLVKLQVKIKHLLLGLLFGFVVTRIGLSFMGSPYHDDSSGYPTPQRHFIMHTIRTNYDRNGTVEYSDSGFWFREIDSNVRQTIESVVSPMVEQQHNALCAKAILCGLPFESGRHLPYGGWWLPGPAPNAKKWDTLKLNQIKSITDYEKEISVSLVLKNGKTSFRLRSSPQAQLMGWSLSPGIPKPLEWNNERAYVATLLQGFGETVLNISINVKTVIADYNGPLVDLSVANYEYDSEHTQSFSELLAKMPSWAHIVPSVVTVNSWTF